jgi:LPXTG-motif cell wall-anchored protein
MYGKGAGALNVATGVSLLPETGSNHSLFVLATSLLVSGAAVFVASTIMARKNRAGEVK